MRPAPFSHTAVAVVSGLFVLALAVALPYISGVARASHAGGMDAMSIDMDVAGNTATSLGPRDNCVVAAPGATVTLDVTAQNIPVTNPMIGFTFVLTYPPAVASVTAGDPGFLLASTAGSSLLDASEPTPDTDGAYNGAAIDLSTPDAAEVGSGVLMRITMPVHPQAPAGQYILGLTFAAHADPQNEVRPPDVLNHAYLAVNSSCENLPTLTPTPAQTPTPTPQPISARFGIDHNGAPPDINPGPALVPPGQSGSVSVVTVAPPSGLGFWDVLLTYDSAILDALSCSPAPQSVCNVDAGVNQVALSGATVAGVFGSANLMDVVFQAVGVDGQCSPLTVIVTAVGDPLGNPVGSVVQGGNVCVGSGPPGAAVVGIDHNGPPADINPGPAFAPAGQNATVAVAATAPTGGIGALDVLVTYDPAVLTAVSCVPAPNAVCNANASPNRVALSFVSLAGMFGTAGLADFVFHVGAASTGCSPLDVTVTAAGDPTGSSIGAISQDGMICVGVPPSPTPQPTTTPPPPVPGVPPFDPGGVVCLETLETAARCDGDASPAAASDIRNTLCLGWNLDCTVRDVPVLDSNFSGTVSFVSPGFAVPAGGDLPIGAIAGSLATQTTLGLINNPCNSSLAVSFTFLNASTNPNDVIFWDQPDSLAADSNANGVPDGADRYPAFLNPIFSGAEPRARLFGITLVQGIFVVVNFVVLEPGATVLTPEGPLSFDPALGHPVFAILQDPTSPIGPSVISDFCAPFLADNVTLGLTMDNPCTPVPITGANCPGPGPIRQNAGYPFLPCENINFADEDGDGKVNDGCPTVNNVAESGVQCDNNISDDFEDASINDGCPQVGDVSEGSRIPGACVGGDEGGCIQRANPGATGAFTFAVLTESQRDADGDGIENNLDPCALIPNPEWNPRAFDPANDPDNDGLPNACDPAPNSPGLQTPQTCPLGATGNDEDQDCYSNRLDNCPNVNQLFDGFPTNFDFDFDAIGDLCDPQPETPNGGKASVCMFFDVLVGQAGPPAPPVIDRNGPDCATVPCAPPANDAINDAAAFSEIPFSDQLSTLCATPAPDDPGCFGTGATVWYSFSAPATQRIKADTFGSSYDTTISAYTGSPGALTQIACNDDSGSLQSAVVFQAEAGTTYYLMVGSFANGPGGSLAFNVGEGPPPLEIDVEIAGRGTVIPKDGVATVSGTLTCSQPAFVDISGSLEQQAGRATINGFFFETVECDSYLAWSATIQPENGRLVGGPASVSVFAIGFGQFEIAEDEASAAVRLRGQRPPEPRATRCPRDGNLGFESGTVNTNAIPCWTVADIGPGTWCNQAGTSAPEGPCLGSFAPVEPPPDGTQAAMTGQEGAGAHVLFACGTLRSGVVGFQLYLNNLAGVFVTAPALDPFSEPNQQFRADLVSRSAVDADPFTVAPGDVLMNLYQTQPGDPPVSGYVPVAADAGAFVGQDLCLRFAEVDNQFFLHAGVDAVNITLRR